MSDKQPKNFNTNNQIFVGGPILTMADSMKAEAVLVAGGHIRRVGSLSACRDIAGPSCQEIDLGGRSLMPGFVDPHAHMLMFAQYSALADLGQPHVKTIQDLLDELKVHSQNLPPEVAIRGFGYDQNRLAEGRHPTARYLNRPTAWVNLRSVLLLPQVSLNRTDTHGGFSGTENLPSIGQCCSVMANRA